MKKILQKLFSHQTLSRTEAETVMLAIAEGQYSDAEIASFVTVFLMRSITIAELEGFRDALLQKCMPARLDGFETIDIVGTGGDGKNTFNISTLACFIVAGAGQKVAKHGNYGASSISGSSNLMEELGYYFKTNDAQLKKELSEAGICFLHAPLFHTALKNVAGVRKSLGLRTFFNMLGPLVNPAAPAYQMIGVYNNEMARIYTYMLQKKGQPFSIVHTLDGYDELSLTADAKVITEKGERVYSPLQLGKRTVQAADISGGASVSDAAKIFVRILRSEGTWAQNAVVLANAAMALHTTGKYATYDEAYHTAVESLESGAALKSLQTLIQLQ